MRSKEDTLDAIEDMLGMLQAFQEIHGDAALVTVASMAATRAIMSRAADEGVSPFNVLKKDFTPLVEMTIRAEQNESEI